MSPRAFSNGPTADTERSEALPRRKVKTHRDHPMGTFDLPRIPVRSRVNTVDRLTGNDRSKLPLTAIQAEALDALSDVPAWPTAVAARCSLRPKQVAMAMYPLSAKGLAVRTSEGWRLP